MSENTKRLEQQIADKSIAASQIDLKLITGYKGIYNNCVKRIVDFFLSTLILLAVSPIIFFVAVAIFLEDGSPIFYRAERGGFKGTIFKIYKFRSMVKNADAIGGGTTALHDARITKVGEIIRKLKIDEFPNLINVVKGEMSFIGPRPELLRYTEQYVGTEKTIFEVRPGMTDYSSIEFINLDEIVGNVNQDAAYEKLVLPTKNKLRVKYAATVSFTNDIKLFVLTIYKVLKKGWLFFFG